MMLDPNWRPADHDEDTTFLQPSPDPASVIDSPMPSMFRYIHGRPVSPLRSGRVRLLIDPEQLNAAMRRSARRRGSLTMVPAEESADLAIVHGNEGASSDRTTRRGSIRANSPSVIAPKSSSGSTVTEPAAVIPMRSDAMDSGMATSRAGDTSGFALSSSVTAPFVGIASSPAGAATGSVHESEDHYASRSLRATTSASATAAVGGPGPGSGPALAAASHSNTVAGGHVHRDLSSVSPSRPAAQPGRPPLASRPATARRVVSHPSKS